MHTHSLSLSFPLSLSHTHSLSLPLGRIKRGDILVAINGHYVIDLPFNDVIGVLKKQNSPFIYLRFLRWSYYEERHEGMSMHRTL